MDACLVFVILLAVYKAWDTVDHHLVGPIRRLLFDSPAMGTDDVAALLTTLTDSVVRNPSSPPSTAGLPAT